VTADEMDNDVARLFECLFTQNHIFAHLCDSPVSRRKRNLLCKTIRCQLFPRWQIKSLRLERRLRMGTNSGPVDHVSDVTGAAINLARRVAVAGALRCSFARLGRGYNASGAKMEPVGF